ncbi:MAG: hypothetical protein ACLFVP_00380 [Candidatus Bathyarchaeia archaeon]
MPKETKKRDVELKTEWQDTQVELQKALHGYKLEERDKKDGKIDYITEERGKKKLLRVLVDEKLREYKADLETVRDTLEEVEEREIDEAMILAKRFTSSARRLAKDEDSLAYASSSSKPVYSPVEILFAIQKQLQEYCKAKCGKVPTSEDECPGYRDGSFTCLGRRISDDADFHAERQWLQLLVDDFAKLVELTRKIKEDKVPEEEEV